MSLSSAQVLVESLEKKSRILDEIIKENEAQERLFKQEELDLEALDSSSDRMGELAEKLALLAELDELEITLVGLCTGHLRGLQRPAHQGKASGDTAQGGSCMLCRCDEGEPRGGASYHEDVSGGCGDLIWNTCFLYWT